MRMTTDTDERSAAASRGDDDRVWPDVPRAARLAAHRAIFETARRVFDDTGPPPNLQCPDGTAPLGIAAYRSGLGPLLGTWIADGRVRAAPEVASLFATHLEQGRRRAERLNAVCDRILDAAAPRAVVPVLLKGAHTERYFPSSGARPRSDIDLLVEPGHAPAIAAALRDAGLVETRRTAVPPRWEWGPPEPQTVHTFTIDHADNPWSVDVHTSLHRTYARGFTAGAPEPFAHTSGTRIRGRAARVLKQPLLTTYLAQHAAHPMHGLRLLRLVELVYVIRGDAAARALEWSSFLDYVTHTGLARFTYPALALVNHLAPKTIPTEVEAALSAAAPPRMRTVTAAVAAAGGQLERRSLADKLMWAATVRERARVLLDVLRADPDAPGSPGWWGGYVRRARLLIRRR